MRTSEKTGALVEALAKAKATIKPPKKSHTGKVSGTSKRSGKDFDYEYKYADRSDLIESYTAAIAGNGLVISHATDMIEGTLYAISRLSHSSGEFIESRLPIPAEASRDAKILGGFLTYYCRYQSSCLLDVAGEDDDDGERAVAPKRHRPDETAEPDEPQEMPFSDVRKAIAKAAEDLAQRGGGTPDTLILRASHYIHKGDGKPREFSDPYLPRVSSEAWLKTTLDKLTKQLTESEPGAAEGAEALK